MSMNDDVREQIRRDIQTLGISQAEVARRMGMKPQELNRALRERGKLPQVWQTILDFFGYDVALKKKDR